MASGEINETWRMVEGRSFREAIQILQLEANFPAEWLNAAVYISTGKAFCIWILPTFAAMVFQKSNPATRGVCVCVCV